jgi:hypothetical protein
MALQRINWLQIDTATVPSGSVIDIGAVSGPLHAGYFENLYISGQTISSFIAGAGTNELNTFSASVKEAIETTGSNLTVRGNLLVKGTTTSINSTTVAIGDNIIELNGSAATNAGLVVRDATESSLISGSLLWDTTLDYWKGGPLGSEQKIVLIGELNSATSSLSSSINTLSGSLSGSISSLSSSLSASINTLSGSLSGSISSLSSSLSASINTLSGSLSGSISSVSSSITSSIGVISSSLSNRIDQLSTFSSSISGAIEVTGSNVTIKGDLLVKGTTTAINSTTVAIGDNIIELNGTSAVNGGLLIKDPTGGTTISGSLLWDSTLDYWKAGQLGSEEKIVLIGELNSATSSLSSSINTLSGSLSGSITSLSSSLSGSINTLSSSLSSSINTLSGSISSSISQLSSSVSTSIDEIYTAIDNLEIGLNASNIWQQTGSFYSSNENIQITGSNAGLMISPDGSTVAKYALSVSQSIHAANINVGNPTSNDWGSNLNGSYFNNFNKNTDVSEILRFVAGLLSSSAPDASPNTKTYSTYTANAVNTTTGTVTAGSVPLSSTNTTITYLQGKGFATTGSTIFSGVGTINTNSAYGYTYTSVAAGSTIVSSSVDSQLFGLGLLSSGAPTSFKVSGSFNFKFKDNSAKTDTATSSSNHLITQTGAGTTSGVSLAKINTANSAVIPAAYQDGKFATVFSPALFNNGASAISGSGYYHISASIAIASGSSVYTTPITSNVEVFYAPLTTISTNVPANTITATAVNSALTAVSRSLSGAPYLTGGTYNVSSSVTGAFNPLYHAGTNLGYQSVSGTGLALTSGTSTLTTAGGTVGTLNSVYDSTGVTVRSTGTIPYETDIVKLNGLYTFTAPSTSNVVSASGSTTPTTFTVTTNANNKNSSASTYNTQTISYHTAGSFGQPAASGSLAYYGRAQATDSSTTLIESFTGESYRLQVNNNILTFSGDSWSTTFGLYNLGATDLQVKPSYLVKPGGAYGYWLANPSSASDYKYYIRKISSAATSNKVSMTLNVGQALVNWTSTTSNSVAVALLFESAKSGIYTPSRFFDPSDTLSNVINSSISANTDGTNPFGSAIALYGNTGGSLSSTTYTIPLRAADGFTVNATYDEVYVIIRYKGDPTPISSITTTFS